MNKRQLRKTLRRVLKESAGAGCVQAALQACSSNPACSDFLAQMNVTEVGEFWLDHCGDGSELGGECHAWIENYLTSCDGWKMETEAMIVLWTICNS